MKVTVSGKYVSL